MSPKALFPVKKIMCPTDLSEPSFAGIDAASTIAENQSAELIIVHVVTPIYYGGAPGTPASYNANDYYVQMENLATRNIDEYLKNKRITEKISTRTIIKRGIAAEEIVEAAEKEDADIIVIATHGWTGWRRFIFGSVTEKVVRLSKLPVLTIPEPVSDSK